LLKNTFDKQERLSGKKAIDSLFLKGSSLTQSPLKIIIKASQSTQIHPCKAMFVVPKKKFKRAHDRNLLKRRMREAYRLFKNNYYALLNEKELKANCAILYVGDKEATYQQVEIALQALLKQSVNKIKPLR
jgi:ribonuclease P protein component